MNEIVTIDDNDVIENEKKDFRLLWYDIYGDDNMLSYEGVFFDSNTEELIHSLENPQLDVVNDEIHCTFKYHPDDDEIFDELCGQEVDVLIIGYGNDGQNSGFELQLSDDIMPYYINNDEDKPGKLKKPHITASLALGAKASKTKDLDFKKLDVPIRIKGVFGYWIKTNDKEYKSFEKFKKNTRWKNL